MCPAGARAGPGAHRGSGDLGQSGGREPAGGEVPPAPGRVGDPGTRGGGRGARDGSGVARFRPGDRVMTLVAGGGYAEFACAYEGHLLRDARDALVGGGGVRVRDLRDRVPQPVHAGRTRGRRRGAAARRWGRGEHGRHPPLPHTGARHPHGRDRLAGQGGAGAGDGRAPRGGLHGRGVRAGGARLHGGAGGGRGARPHWGLLPEGQPEGHGARRPPGRDRPDGRAQGRTQPGPADGEAAHGHRIGAAARVPCRRRPTSWPSSRRWWCPTSLPAASFP